MGSYTLRFASSFRKIEVIASDQSVASTWDLDTGSESVQLSIASGNYEIDYETDFSEPSLTIDVGPGLTLGFSGNKFGGIGIIDLRDPGMQGDPCSMEVSHDLSCGTFNLKYVSGPFALKVLASDMDCITYSEA